MKVGYPCSNPTIGSRASRTFRLASYSPDRFLETVRLNLEGLLGILEWNLEHDIRYFRISSGTITLSSHPIIDVDWQRHFADQLAAIGDFIIRNRMRINVHPGQYTLLNSPKPDVVERSIAELMYHAELIDLMGLDDTNKIQIHTGGVYGEKEQAIQRFIDTYATLPSPIRARLVIENDDRQYSLQDNLVIYEACGIPLLFDTFHHSIFNNGESLPEAFDLFMPTWNGHGTPMMDYSSQHGERRTGAHTMSIDLNDFAKVINDLGDRDIEIMLEIKDKEQSALKAIAWLDARQPHLAERRTLEPVIQDQPA
ncbi:MAG: UV DNA damage repair endonuclease UvsE [Thermomicrobiales bacterium]